MADLYRRLPLLLLVALLLLIVVVIHIYFLGRVPGRKQTHRTPKRSTKMDKLQTKTMMSVGGGGSSRQRCNSAEGGKRPYDPALYSHLPSHEIPLPPSDDDVDDPRSSTVPLGSDSTQDWMGSQVYRHASTPTYTDLLEGRTPAGYDAGLVDLSFGLSFGLRSRSGEGLTHTVVVNPASASKHTSPSVRAVGPAASRGFVLPRRVALSTASVAASRTKTVGLAGCRTTTPGGAIDREGDDDERDTTEVVDRQFWDDERQQLHSTNTASITRGVARISVGAEDEFEDCAGGGGEEIAADDDGDDNDEDDDGEMEIRSVGRKRGGSTARTKMGVTSRKAVDCGKKWDNLYQQFKSVHKFMGESGKPNFFTLTPGERRERGFDLRMDERVYSEMKAMSGGDHTIHPTNFVDTGALGGVQLPGTVRGRNESGGSDVGGGGQSDDRGSTRDSSFSGGGGGGAGKRKNVRQQTFEAMADVMKEHGALMSMTVDSASKRQCSILTRQCDILEREIQVQKDHYEKADQANFMIQAPQLFAFGMHFFVDDMAPRGASGKAKRNSGSGDGGETQKGRGHIPKSKRSRFDHDSSEHSGDLHGEEESMVDAQGADVMKRLGFGRDGVSRDQLAALKQGLVGGVAVSLARTPKSAGIVMTDAHVARQVPPKVGHVAPCQPIPALQAGTLGVEKTPSAQKVDTTARGGRTAAADNTTGSGVAEDSVMVKNGVKEDDLEERSKLWIDCDAFWGQGPGKPLREAVGDCTDYFVAIANGDAGAEPPSMLVMSPNDVPRFKIDHPAQCEPALRRVRNVEKVVLRAIYGRIFKSSSRSTSFAPAESYVTVDFATDVAQAVWQALEWSKVVSPALVYHTLVMKMDVPLWFVGVKFVDRPEDDDMAARQEATVLRLADCWTNAVWCGQWADGGRVKQDRLTRLADCLRVLLSACMWIMRMGGDDDRSHYEASFYASMVAKPTLIVAGSCIVN
ncbi:hypothetical protein CBR_g29324 [Chara braunii]|uniref:Uncharacterized protein n=1 Tax=Chara braunii TaxID=69332 RepID=A0A388JWE6_CHABU|nr:hypothetical protein CBR_g29324 [Chara braunii]|eukprot:GBG62124.1 hypothetical protein CBR_g29324 [Chara braunii]